MKKILLIISICIVALGCQRRALTYDYSPFCEVVVNVDWASMSTAPTGMSVRAYPESGEKPIVVQTNDISRAILKLPAGVYNILVFNQIPSDYGTVSFRGLDRWETTEVYSNESTKAPWAVSKSESTIVREPEVIAAATYTGVEISEESVRESTERYELTGERIVTHTLEVAPKIVVKRANVRVKVDGIYNLRSTRAVFTGMSNGYNFSTQQSIPDRASHVLENWKIEDFAVGDRYGETNTYFISFGLPSTTTATRPNDDWKGSIYLEMLLVDNKPENVVKHTADITAYTSVHDSDSSKVEDEDNPSSDIEVETTITVKVGLSDNDDDPMVVLPDVKPEGGSAGGFDAVIDKWDKEVITEIPI